MRSRQTHIFAFLELSNAVVHADIQTKTGNIPRCPSILDSELTVSQRTACSEVAYRVPDVEDEAFFPAE